METKTGTTKQLLIVTSLLEGSTGLALMTIPSFVVNLLLESPLTDPITLILTRVGGAAVVALAVACWFLRKNEKINGLIIAMLFYNVASIILFAYAALYENLSGIALWPAVAIHIVTASWCVICLISTGRINSTE